uniref:Uncharacterized protein n=1 Tax=Picea glauca TaxID=3330 RepID=A0A124GMI4_PICGL|nr:hypothetical protein ABT39_MTgene2338 [Picea glauca]
MHSTYGFILYILVVCCRHSELRGAPIYLARKHLLLGISLAKLKWFSSLPWT